MQITTERYSIFQGDCFDLFEKIEEKSVSLVLTDLPYGTTDCEWDSVIDLNRMWNELSRICLDNTAYVFTAVQPFTTILGASNIPWLRYNWVWQKNNVTGHMNAKRRPLKMLEDILVFYKNQPIYNPQGLIEVNKTVRNSNSDLSIGTDRKATSTVAGRITRKEYVQQYTNYPKQLLTFNNEPNPVHQTQKPVDLLEYLIKTYTNENDIVLDFTMGSGSTGVASINTGRKFIGFEKTSEYFKISSERIQAAAQHQALFDFH